MFEGKQAIGVLLKREGGQEKVVLANKEIILTAGTVGTTKLLLLSGIGPRAHLQEMKVTMHNNKCVFGYHGIIHILALVRN